VSDAALSVLETLAPDAAKAADAEQKLRASRDKELGDTKELEGTARTAETKTELEEKRALKLDIGEGLLELGLVLTSLYFLARNDFFPIFGVLCAIGGITMGILGWML
jgi:hypothetical protein